MHIGLMGGTFDPPHLGHIVPVEAAAAEFALDLVWFIPASVPPHKYSDDLTDPYHRAAMLALALQRYPKFLLSPAELLKGEVRYTVDTVQEFRRTLSEGDRLYFLMGADSFLELHTWHSYDQLIRLCELIIIRRGANERELKEKLEQLETILQSDLKSTIHFARTPDLPISSTEIRATIRDGQAVSSRLTPEVEAYIRKHSLYERR